MENILDIIESIAHEKGLSPDNVKEAVNVYRALVVGRTSVQIHTIVSEGSH